MRKLFLILIFLGSLAASPFTGDCAAQATLTWNPSPDPQVAAYNLCWGTNSGNYFSTNSYPNTQFSATVSNLPFTAVYYFAVAAVSSNGQVSPFSNEAIYTNNLSNNSTTNGNSNTNLLTGPPIPGTSNNLPIFVPNTPGPTNLPTPTNFAQAQILGVPPTVTLSFANGQPSLNITGTVGANVLIQGTTDPSALYSWTTITNVMVTNLAAVNTNSQSGQPPDALDLAFVPAAQTFLLPQTNAAVQYYRVVMPYDYAILASTVLPPKGYTPRLILVNMPGTLDDVCYVNEATSFIHYSPTNYALQLVGSSSTIRQIATTLANSLSLDWTTASEFTYSNGMGQILATVVETEPASSDPVAGQNPPSAPIVINF